MKYIFCSIIFGISLEEAIKRSSKLNPNIPDIISKCINYLYKNGIELFKCFYLKRMIGIQEEGIFRLSGSVKAVQEIKFIIFWNFYNVCRNKFNQGEDVDLEVIKDEHVVAGLLKLYFRELPGFILLFLFFYKKKKFRTYHI